MIRVRILQALQLLGSGAEFSEAKDGPHSVWMDGWRILQSYSSFDTHDMSFPNEYVRTVAISFTRCAAIDKVPHFGIRTENENLVGCSY